MLPPRESYSSMLSRLPSVVECRWQLLYTILKSALLLATKEEIARVASSAVLLGDEGARRLSGSGDLVSKNEPIRAGGGRGEC